MIAANGENRQYIGLAFAGALAAAVGTKLGEWAVERTRRALGDPAPAPPNPGKTP